MGVATLTNVPTVIHLFEDNTNVAPDTYSDSPDIKKQGTYAQSCALTNNGVNETYVTGSWDFTTDVHLRLWFNIAFVGNLATSDAIQISLYDGTNTALYTIKQSDSYAGGWSQAVIYTGNTPTSGTVTKSSITRIGLQFNTASKPRNVPANAYFDAWYYGDGYRITGGTSGDAIGFTEVAILDAIEAYGIIELYEGVFYLAGDIEVGNGATTTYWFDNNKAIFKDLPVLATLYQLHFLGSGCNVEVDGGLWGVSGTAEFDLNTSDVDLNSCTITGKQIEGASAVSHKAGQSITSSTYDGCGQIVPSTAVFNGITVRNYVGTDGALLWPTNDSNIANVNFINCDNSVEYDATSDGTSPTFNNITFDDVSGNYDVNNTQGSSVTIVLSGTSNGNSFNPAGDTVIFDAPKQFTFDLSENITGYEWRIYEITAVGSLVGASEVAGQESATQDNQTYNYNYSGDQPIAVQIISQPDEDYEEVVRYYTLVNSNQAVTIILTPDNNN